MQSGLSASQYVDRIDRQMEWVDFSSDTVFCVRFSDADGHRLHGANQYVLRFPDGELPPARYWRINLYDMEGFFCENSINRYGIGNLANGLLLDASYSLTLYIQHESPGESRKPAWLPAPRGAFFVMLRMCDPVNAIQTGAYALPSIKKAREAERAVTAHRASITK